MARMTSTSQTKRGVRDQLLRAYYGGRGAAVGPGAGRDDDEPADRVG